MLRHVSPWTTILWLIPYLCGMVRANVWPADTEHQWSVGALLFLAATSVACDILMRWFRYQIITEVRRSYEASRDEKPISTTDSVHE